jgi:hypothetical protein
MPNCNTTRAKAEAPASNSGDDPDTARRVAQERRIAREGRQAEHERSAYQRALDLTEGTHGRA